ncbi:MAG: YkgJ family cysteine cluster protein [Gammaproteobacteria bacterium]|nr:MAG: YkgJ family cysteine cluster protein [Gammaproteobacteria bacterium]
MSTNESPCLACGACCASFRVSFYWAETDNTDNPNAVPVTLTEQLTPYRSCMQGTNSPTPRCTALLGDIGNSVRCTIYERRPSPCREFPMAWENGIANPDCDKARARWGLPPLTPAPSHDGDNPFDRTPPKVA